MGKRFQSPLLLAALVLCILLWGSAVAGHQHLDNEQQCEICLLPHAADVAPPLPQLAKLSPIEHRYQFSQSGYIPLHSSVYWGRAPPSVSSSV